MNMNLDKYDEKYKLEENYEFVQKIPKLDKFLGLFDLYVGVHRFTFVLGLLWGLMVAAAFHKKDQETGIIFLCFWIFCILGPLAGVLWGFKINKRSFLFPPLVVLFFVVFAAVIFAIMEIANNLVS